jgi:mannose-6-phosphate isomerase-like protein (cupin superfamily)
MEDKNLVKIDDKMSVKKITNISESEEQDSFLEKELENFLQNDVSKILDTYQQKKEVEEVSSRILDLYQIIDEFKIDIDEEDILNLLQIENRWPFKYFYDVENQQIPSLSPIYGKDTPIQVITTENNVEFSKFYDRDGAFIFDEWKKYYDLGFVTMISNVLDLTPELRNLRKKLFEITGMNLIGNFYFSKHVSSYRSWLPHSHHYSVIVKVIYGKTKWRISDDIFEYTENDTILIPKNTDHSVVECLSDRLTLTINLF